MRLASIGRQRGHAFFEVVADVVGEQTGAFGGDLLGGEPPTECQPPVPERPIPPSCQFRSMSVPPTAGSLRSAGRSRLAARWGLVGVVLLTAAACSTSTESESSPISLDAFAVVPRGEREAVSRRSRSTMRGQGRVRPPSHGRQLRDQRDRRRGIVRPLAQRDGHARLTGPGRSARLSRCSPASAESARPGNSPPNGAWSMLAPELTERYPIASGPARDLVVLVDSP